MLYIVSKNLIDMQPYTWRRQPRWKHVLPFLFIRFSASQINVATRRSSEEDMADTSRPSAADDHEGSAQSQAEFAQRGWYVLKAFLPRQVLKLEIVLTSELLMCGDRVISV